MSSEGLDELSVSEHIPNKNMRRFLQTYLFFANSLSDNLQLKLAGDVHHSFRAVSDMACGRKWQDKNKTKVPAAHSESTTTLSPGGVQKVREI